MKPYTLIAELTHRCPLRCPYCSNPVELVAGAHELGTAGWLRAIDEAADLGCVQAHFTGGEPLARRDLEELVGRAAGRGLYPNLITSGIGGDAERLLALREAGLLHVQLSMQDVDAERGDAIAGFPAHARKLAFARQVAAAGVSLTINVVLHRDNIARVHQLVALAESLGPDRIELANAQWLGWALHHRDALLPTDDQMALAREQAATERARLFGRIELTFALADHFSSTPRACMSGWGRQYLHVAPDGLVLPCHSARTLQLEFERVGERPLAEIWEGAAFSTFRGERWMQEPCASCERRTVDFGGCRCQAFALTGEAAATDPACAKSSRHALVRAAPRSERRFLHRGTVR